MKAAPRRTHLFLIELVLNLFLFVLCATVCTGLLLHAKTLSNTGSLLTQGVYLAQSAAECWKAGDSPATAAATANESSADLTVFVRPRGNTADVVVRQGDQVIYQLEGVCRLE